MSKDLYAVENPDLPLPASYIRLEDDVLDPIWRLASRARLPAACSLFEDLYGDARFDPEGAIRLADDCRQLALKAEAEPKIAIWLLTVSAFAGAAGAHGGYVLAIAD